jgi:hypothetical protein
MSHIGLKGSLLADQYKISQFYRFYLIMSGSSNIRCQVSFYLVTRAYRDSKNSDTVTRGTLSCSYGSLTCHQNAVIRQATRWQIGTHMIIIQLSPID